MSPARAMTVNAVRHSVVAEIERRIKAHEHLVGNARLDLGDRFASAAEAYRAALRDLAGWLEGADLEELVPR